MDEPRREGARGVSDCGGYVQLLGVIATTDTSRDPSPCGRIVRWSLRSAMPSSCTSREEEDGDPVSEIGRPSLTGSHTRTIASELVLIRLFQLAPRD